MKKLLSSFSLLTAMVSMLVIPLSVGATVVSNWNATGTYVVAMNYLSVDYPHDMVLSQDTLGNLTGQGGSPVGANVYTWVITSGTVVGNTIDFLANYTATADAVTPQTVMHVTGTIAPNGTITGTWSDNYQGGARSGTLMTTSGVATVLSPEDFGVVNYDTGLGILKGYTAGFGLTNATFAGVQSVVVQLFASSTLLQTNTATAKVGVDVTGSQISSPFDVSGTFDYVTDGYWTNVRASEYGQSVPATRVVATVTLADGRVVVAENDLLAGDGTTVFPPPPPANVTVHIFKFVDGVQATASSTNSATFPMFTPTFNAPFTLGVGGWTAGDIDYEASTSAMPVGSSYSANEVTTTALVSAGPLCDGVHPYALIGYGVGTTSLSAQQAVLSTSTPMFTNMQSDEYIIVQNRTCAITPPVATSSISGMKFNDLNHNGLKDVNEPGLQGWTIKLKNAKGKVSTTTVTGADGTYSFLNLPDGTYKLREVHQKGWKRMSLNPQNIVIVAGSVVSDVNFGNALKQKAEREDNDNDDDRDDQYGWYQGGHGHSDYSKNRGGSNRRDN